MNILVPTDFSEVANVAVRYAALLARKLDAKIILFHAIPHQSVWLALTNDELVRDAHQKQDRIKAKLIKDGVNADKIEMHIFYQFPINKWINDFVRKNKIDFAVIGTKGATGLKNVMLGSFALGMIEHVTIPVIAVPPDASTENISNILYPTDMEDILNEVKKLVVFSKAFDAVSYT